MPTGKFLSALDMLPTLQLIMILGCSLIFVAGCSTDKIICTKYTELTGHNHLVDISALNAAPELIDTLTKYPQLQVYKVINDQYIYGMHCSVFYKGLKVFTDYYTLFKRKPDNSIFTGGYSIVDSINISLTPSIQFDRAIDIARQNMNFNNTCISYRLGIYNFNSNASSQTKNYKLSWKVEGENGYPFVILDANSGLVYTRDNGRRY